MNQYACLRTTCKHDAFRPVVMLGKIIHWRCRCGRVVAEPHMSNRVASYIGILQRLATERRKRGVLSQEKEAEYSTGMNVCRNGMSSDEERFLDRVVSEFSCLRIRKPTCHDETVV
jgi:hypothetical protein